MILVPDSSLLGTLQRRRSLQNQQHHDDDNEGTLQRRRLSQHQEQQYDDNNDNDNDNDRKNIMNTYHHHHDNNIKNHNNTFYYNSEVSDKTTESSSSISQPSLASSSFHVSQHSPLKKTYQHDTTHENITEVDHDDDCDEDIDNSRYSYDYNDDNLLNGINMMEEGIVSTTTTTTTQDHDIKTTTWSKQTAVPNHSSLQNVKSIKNNHNSPYSIHSNNNENLETNTFHDSGVGAFPNDCINSISSSSSSSSSSSNSDDDEEIVFENNHQYNNNYDDDNNSYEYDKTMSSSYQRQNENNNSNVTIADYSQDQEQSCSKAFQLQQLNIFRQQQQKQRKWFGLLFRQDSDNTIQTSHSKKSTITSASSSALKKKKKQIAEKENKRVMYIRCIIFILLLVSCIIVSIIVYKITQNNEYTEFYNQYTLHSYKIIESIGMKLDTTLSSLDSFSISLCTDVIISNQSWPYITLTQYPIRAAKYKSMSSNLLGGIFIETSILIQNDQRTSWENYSYTNGISWINDSLLIQNTDPNYYGPKEIDMNDINLTQCIYGDFGDIPYNITRRFLPSWHMYPVIPIWDQGYNWDWLSDENLPEATLKVIDYHTTIITEPYMLFNISNNDDIELRDILVGWFQNFLNPNQIPDEPMSDIMFPIINVLDRVDSTKELNNNHNHNSHSVNVTHPSNPAVVGAIRTPFYWRDTIRHILPNDNDGIIVVFHNPCTESFTYQINGPDAIYLGRGDLHDSKYDHMKKENNIFELEDYVIDQSEYTGPHVDKSYCSMTITTYPSDVMKDTYCSNNPLIFASVTVLIFIFTSFVFILYDYSVERRQDVVMSSAEKSNAIVSSMFPSHIADKLLSDETNPATSASTPMTSATTNDSIALTLTSMPTTLTNTMTTKSDDKIRDYQMQSFLDNDGNPGVFVDKCEETDFLVLPEPIADTYENTTVMFTEISGLHKWSINRDAKDIFILLEVLYSTFDSIANEMHITKVESIGDSYVTVSGISNDDTLTTNQNHAVTMVEFSAKILAKTVDILTRLSSKFGKEITNLHLSIGISSGSIVAGVMRSINSRFQVYGNTATTAEKIQKISAPGRIHCSETTAEQLIDCGKKHWLKKRDDGLVLTQNGAVFKNDQTNGDTNQVNSISLYWVYPSVGSSNGSCRAHSIRMDSEFSLEFPVASSIPRTRRGSLGSMESNTRARRLSLTSSTSLNRRYSISAAPTMEISSSIPLGTAASSSPLKKVKTNKSMAPTTTTDASTNERHTRRHSLSTNETSPEWLLAKPIATCSSEATANLLAQATSSDPASGRNMTPSSSSISTTSSDNFASSTDDCSEAITEVAILRLGMSNRINGTNLNSPGRRIKNKNMGPEVTRPMTDSSVSSASFRTMSSSLQQYRNDGKKSDGSVELFHRKPPSRAPYNIHQHEETGEWRRSAPTRSSSLDDSFLRMQTIDNSRVSSVRQPTNRSQRSTQHTSEHPKHSFRERDSNLLVELCHRRPSFNVPTNTQQNKQQGEKLASRRSAPKRSKSMDDDFCRMQAVGRYPAASMQEKTNSSQRSSHRMPRHLNHSLRETLDLQQREIETHQEDKYDFKRSLPNRSLSADGSFRRQMTHFYDGKPSIQEPTRMPFHSMEEYRMNKQLPHDEISSWNTFAVIPPGNCEYASHSATQQWNTAAAPPRSRTSDNYYNCNPDHLHMNHQYHDTNNAGHYKNYQQSQVLVGNRADDNLRNWIHNDIRANDDSHHVSYQPNDLHSSTSLNLGKHNGYGNESINHHYIDRTGGYIQPESNLYHSLHTDNNINPSNNSSCDGVNGAYRIQNGNYHQDVGSHTGSRYSGGYDQYENRNSDPYFSYRNANDIQHSHYNKSQSYYIPHS